MHLWTDTLHAIAVGYLVSSILILEVSRRWQIIVTVSLLVLYWLVMALIPVPGHGAGIYEPDINLAIYVDNLILGHWQEGAGWTYILTNMTFICSVMLGVFAGQLLQSDRKPMKKGRVAGADRSLLCHCREGLGNMVPDNPPYLDKYSGPFCRRIELSSAGAILPRNRHLGLQEMGILFCGYRDECNCSLCGDTFV